VNRREFITLLGGAAATWPLAARAQQPDRVRRIGILAHLPSDDADAQSRNAAFLQGLQELVQATAFETVVNLRAAKALGVMIPTAILLRADEVIE
jgi:putative tryptophan/tyrosine transport system substrate-binding protein